MIPYYQAALYLSITLSGLFLWRWNKYISVSFSVIYLLIPIINLGYLRLAVAQTLDEAILANGIVYMCSVYIQFGFLMYIFSFCKVKFPRLLTIPLFALSGTIGSIALTANRNPLLYTNVDIAKENGVTYLVKSYGVIHTVYLALMGFYIIIEFVTMLMGLKRKDVSRRNSILLFLIYFMNIASFVIARAISLRVELQPVMYVLTQVTLLVMSNRLRMYAVSDMAVSTINEEGKIGFASFDLSRHYLGSSGPAETYLTELKNKFIDAPIANDPEFQLINKWLDTLDKRKRNVEFDLKRGKTNYRVTASNLYVGKRVKGYQLRIEDNTDEKRYIKLLQAARESAEAVSKAKGDFLANMSHEIRTPINAILGMDEMILRESEEQKTIEYAEDIRKAGNTLLGLINDILDFSKIEAGKTDIIPVDYSLSSVLNDLTNMIEGRAAEKGLRFIVNVDPTIPDSLHGDEIRIKQIITNILTNAVKYTNEGSVTLNVAYTRHDQTLDLNVSVRDTGIGIKKEDLDKLFIAFERLDEGRNRSIEGTGLGLSIVQSLLTLMNSRLEIESEYGKGSMFGFSLKQGIVKDAPIGDYTNALEDEGALRKKYHESFRAPDAKVLVVDDTEMNIVVFKGLLKKTEIKIDSAFSGNEAIEMARRNKYDLIFLDHRMPVKDGVQTLIEMKEDKEGLNFNTPTICLTANAVSGVREKYISVGFVEYLSKPIDPARLEAMIIEFLPPELIIASTSVSGSGETEEDRSELLEIYLNDIDSMSALIEDLYNKGDWENYTIKVHALKSTSKLVGEDELALLAESLEHAGERGDIDLIREKTGDLLEIYRGIKKKYGRENKPAAAVDKPEAEPEFVEEGLESLRIAVSNFDYDMLCDILDELGTYKIPEQYSEKFAELSAAAEKVDWGTLKQILL